MPEASTELQTANDFLEFTWRSCRAVNPDFRWTAEDMSTPLVKGATVYATQYTGTFDFMVDMRRQAFRGTLSANQAKGVLNCMMAEVRRERQAAAPRETVDMSALMALFRRAGASLRNPRITLMLEGTGPVTLKLMTRGQYPGTINVVSGSWPNQTWYGRIGLEGDLVRGRAMTEPVLTLIRELSENPVAAAQRYAALTGNCCFCNLPLTDERSTTAGYGPICAGHYGLPWGDRTVETEEPSVADNIRRLRSGRMMRRLTPQVAALPGMTPLGLQADTIVAGHPRLVACRDCPAFSLCEEAGSCEGGVVA